MMNLNRSISHVLKASLLTAGLFLFTPTEAAAKTETFGVGNKTFLLNGKPFIIKAAEVHYPRIPRPYWEQRIEIVQGTGHEHASACMSSGTCTNRKKASSTSRATRTSRKFCRLAQEARHVRHRTPGSRMYVPNGKWAVCPGGC